MPPWPEQVPEAVVEHDHAPSEQRAVGVPCWPPLIHVTTDGAPQLNVGVGAGIGAGAGVGAGVGVATGGVGFVGVGFVGVGLVGIEVVGVGFVVGVGPETPPEQSAGMPRKSIWSKT